MVSLTPQSPNSYKSLLYVATVLDPSYSKDQTLLTGQSWDVPGETQRDFQAKRCTPGTNGCLISRPHPHLSITQITSQEWAHIASASALSISHLCFQRHLMNG